MRTVQPVTGCRFYVLLQSDRRFVEELGRPVVWQAKSGIAGNLAE